MTKRVSATEERETIANYMSNRAMGYWAKAQALPEGPEREAWLTVAVIMAWEACQIGGSRKAHRTDPKYAGHIDVPFPALPD